MGRIDAHFDGWHSEYPSLWLAINLLSAGSQHKKRIGIKRLGHALLPVIGLRTFFIMSIRIVIAPE